MVYIYDILLNFNQELFEFFEWEENDKIKFVRKIPLFKVSPTTLKDFISNKVKINNDFLLKIKGSSDFYEENINKEYNCIAVLSDNKMAIGIKVNNQILNEISRLLLDEEYEILKICDRLEETIIPYEIIENKPKNKNNLTRNEEKIKSELLIEFNTLYKENKIEKLNYYYYEFFGKISNDKKIVYKSLLDSLKNFNNSHINLYNIIKLSYQNK